MSPNVKEITGGRSIVILDLRKHSKNYFRILKHKEYLTNTTKEIPKDDGSWITLEFLQKILQEAEPSQKISVINKDVTFALERTENYLSKIFRIEVQCEKESSENIKKRHLIAKGFPDGEYMQQFIRERGFFERELSIYHSVLPEIQSFAEKKLKNSPIPRFSAKAYPSFRSNTIILEDLKHEGFKMANRKELLDLRHCRLVVRNLACFHGMSVAFNHQNPGVFQKYKEMFFAEDNRKNLELFMPVNMSGLVKQVKTWPGFETYAPKLERFIPVVVDRVIELSKFEENRFNVLRHGDCWVNNYMFKYSSTGEPEDVRFVDFQLASFGSPAMDLCNFLFTSPKNEVKFKHMDQLLLEYHTKLSETLKSLGCSGDLFTFKDVKNEMKRLSFLAFTISCSFLPTVLADAEDVNDVAELTQENFSECDEDYWVKMHKNSRFKKIFQELIVYFEEQGMFN